MEHWDASIVYDLTMTLHRERVARGVAAQSLAATQPALPVRARLADALAALAARLDPICRVVEPPMGVRAPA